MNEAFDNAPEQQIARLASDLVARLVGAMSEGMNFMDAAYAAGLAVNGVIGAVRQAHGAQLTDDFAPQVAHALAAGLQQDIEVIPTTREALGGAGAVMAFIPHQQH